MTPIQWVFQHHVVMQQKRSGLDEKLYLNESLAGDIDMLAMVIDKDRGKSYLEKKAEYRQEAAEKRRKRRGNVSAAKRDKLPEDSIGDHGDDQVQEIMDTYYASAPDTITPPKHLSEQHRFVTGTFSRGDLKRMQGSRKFVSMSDTQDRSEENEIDEIELKPREKNE